MSKLVIAFLTADQRAAIAAAGHSLVTTAESEAAKLFAAAKTKYPALVSAFQIGVRRRRDGYDRHWLREDGQGRRDRASAGAGDLPSLESFLLQMGQTLFTDAIPALETAAVSLLGKLI